MKIWLDTDIGGDIDDALALLLSVAEKDVELVGVSTVFENTDARARIIKTLLEMCGNTHTPVFAGEGFPYKAKYVHGLLIEQQKLPKTYIKEVFDGAEYCKEGAIEGLKNAAEKYGNELSVVSIGALTNIAKFIEKYPEIAEKVNCLYIMGGAQKMNLNEFNFSCDPEAADIVLSSKIMKKIVTLDVTFRCELSARQIERLKQCKSVAVRTVMNMSQLWGEGMILHDPLVLAVAISDEFVRFEKGYLKVELEGEFSRGKCIDLCDFNWRREGREDTLVSTDVKATEFTEYFVARICALDKALIN